MSWHDWDYPPPPSRRRADGIKARSQRGAFGKTWWAGRWIAALERIVDPARLARGRSYARSGQVTQLNVGRAGVDARVQGSRPTPYSVTMRFRALTDDEWERVVDAMAAQAIYAARLLNGEMPEDIESIFAAAGASLFPATGDDLVTDCSCPDWANPCKHLAAVHYLLGERFDDDPFLIFELRGRGKEQIAAALRARRAGTESQDPRPAIADPAADAPPEPSTPLDAAPAAFWTLSGDLAAPAGAFAAPAIVALPIKRLGTPPFWRGAGEFIGEMEALYAAIGERALAAVLGTEP